MKRAEKRAQIIEALKGVKLGTPKLEKYRLCYLFGCWVTKTVFCAESLKEAIFDAKNSAEYLKCDFEKVALIKGNNVIYEF